MGPPEFRSNTYAGAMAHFMSFGLVCTPDRTEGVATARHVVRQYCDESIVSVSWRSPVVLTKPGYASSAYNYFQPPLL